MSDTGREAMGKEKKYCGEGKQGRGKGTPGGAQPGLAPFLRAIEGRRAVLRVPLGEGKGEGNGGPA